MPKHKVQQQRVSLGSRSFHFVSYEAQVANARRGDVEMGPMWCLMRAGKRWPAIPYVEGQSEQEVTRGLVEWLESHGMDVAPAARSASEA
ncbi:MAG TPA: hypothetical protein VM939_04135 [Gemmatimonadaceae bacterium]|nr:hypothetical protein [Gemmatimonadaceae bacterium]